MTAPKNRTRHTAVKKIESHLDRANNHVERNPPPHAAQDGCIGKVPADKERGHPSDLLPEKQPAVPHVLFGRITVLPHARSPKDGIAEQKPEILVVEVDGEEEGRPDDPPVAVLPVVGHHTTRLLDGRCRLSGHRQSEKNSGHEIHQICITGSGLLPVKEKSLVKSGASVPV